MDYNTKYQEELITIGNILQKNYLSIYDRLYQVIIYEFENYREILKKYFSLQEYFDMVVSEIPPSQIEIRKLEKLVECLQYISKNKLSRFGLREKYPEFSKELNKYILWDINESSQLMEIYSAVETSDIIKLKKKFKKSVYGNYKKFIEHLNELYKSGNLTYKLFKEEREKFLSVYGGEKSKKYFSRLYKYEYSTKFKIDSYLFNRIKTLRKKNIYSLEGMDVYDLIDIKENIAPIYWSNINRVFWKGLKREYYRILKTQSKEKKIQKMSVFIFRYNEYSDRIKKLKLWHLD